MKIGQSSKNVNDVSHNITSKKNVDGVAFKFQDELAQVKSKNHQETLIELTRDIFKQGEVIAKRCDIKELKRYKELISSFFNEMVTTGFEFSKEGRYDNRGQKKVYANIKKVNDNMEKLAAELLKAQKNQVEIVNTIEDIRGIILDTFI